MSQDRATIKEENKKDWFRHRKKNVDKSVSNEFDTF